MTQNSGLACRLAVLAVPSHGQYVYASTFAWSVPQLSCKPEWQLQSSPRCRLVRHHRKSVERRGGQGKRATKECDARG